MTNMLPSFSIVIPTYQRKHEVTRAIRSVLDQDYTGAVEVIVVDDGSTDGTVEHLEMMFGGPFTKVKIEKHEVNKGKTFARNTVLRATTNEWVVQLDSDDCLHPLYLSHFARLIAENPDTKLFTCGAAVYQNRDRWFKTRSAFVPQMGEKFASGRIGTGSFVFHKSIAWEIPESKDAYGLDGCFSHLVQEAIPEIKELYGQTPEGHWKALGNPFGDDYALFFKLTRDNQPVGIDLPLYLQNVHL